MKLITMVDIESFRSIRRAQLAGLSHFTAFAGMNNSGKSNVLRALNAFFNDQTDPGRLVDVDADYHRPDLRRKKQKRIRVTVHFDLPNNFQFRKGLENVKQLLGGNSFSITKEWARGQSQASFLLNGDPVDGDGTQKIRQFLSLIKFRYIPNRVLPTDVIRNEHQNLRDILVRRLSRRTTQDEDAFRAIQNTSARIIASLKKRFREACPGQGDVELATPQSWQDLAFAFGYRLIQGSVQIEDIAQGSGVQSLLMLETLYLVDRDYFQQFGWRQAAIWAFEEPESSLHTSLEARVAAYLKQISSEQSSRLQILCTTHSDLIVQYAAGTFVVDKANSESKFQFVNDARQALDELSRAGVSRWIHPILMFPLDPIILVEGEYDVAFLKEAFKVVVPRRTVRVADVAGLIGITGSSGLDKLREYIRRSAGAIRARQTYAPVIVLLDWDARGREQEFSRVVGDSCGDVYKVFTWPEWALNPRLGVSFRGVERVYSDRIIGSGMTAGANIGTNPSGEYMVQADDYGDVKRQLVQIVKQGLTRDDIAHCEEFLRRLLEAAGA
jgi:predicted ATP-dependent endonuclease of OLD family